jgi:hypothetical protein
MYTRLEESADSDGGRVPIITALCRTKYSRCDSLLNESGIVPDMPIGPALDLEIFITTNELRSPNSDGKEPVTLDLYRSRNLRFVSEPSEDGVVPPMALSCRDR